MIKDGEDLLGLQNTRITAVCNIFNQATMAEDQEFIRIEIFRLNLFLRSVHKALK